MSECTARSAAPSKANQRGLRCAVNALNSRYGSVTGAAMRTNSVCTLIALKYQHLAIDEATIGADELFDEVDVHKRFRKLLESIAFLRNPQLGAFQLPRGFPIRMEYVCNRLRSKQ